MSIKPVRVMTTEEGDEDNNIEIIYQTKPRRKCIIILGCGIILLLALTSSILSLILFCRNQNSTVTTDEQAVDTLVNLIDIQNFTESDLDSYHEAFAVFDKDEDGFLNQTEFAAYFGLELGRSAAFEKIDADNDEIWSYPEVVAYVSEMVKRDIIFNTLFKHNTIPAVMRQYGYNGSSRDPLFIEYAAMVMYFNVYDADSNGYIRHDEYLTMASRHDFRFADINSDGNLSSDELYNLLYGDDERSFHGKFQTIFIDGGDSDEFAASMTSISVTVEQVQSVNIQLCPIQESTAVETRRLQVTIDCNDCTVIIDDTVVNCDDCTITIPQK